jgi:DNA-binding PadR family transcriptional regulator
VEKPAKSKLAGETGGAKRAAGPPRVPRQLRGRIKASLEYALLGLIAEQRMLSGYDLVKLFDLSMAHYWHAHHGQIYPTLERMTRRGWIRRRDVIQKRRPNKRLYVITPEGQGRLMEWLESPFEGLRLKHAPLLRCRFLGHLGAEGAREKFAEERAGWNAYLETYRAIERHFFAAGRGYQDVNMMFAYFTLHRGITMMQENIAWCDWAIARISENEGIFGKSRDDESGKDPTDSPRTRRRAAAGA